MKPARRVAVAAVAAGIVSFTYQRIAEARDRHRFPPPGRLVDIGGRRLHLTTAGSGSPAVVIIPALGDNVLVWTHVQKETASETEVCVYDRAGIGWSDPTPRGRLTPDDMAADLHALLTAAPITPPWIVAGHSLGGIIARRFQARYPDDVAGILLVDSSHEQQAERLGTSNWRESKVGALWLAVRWQGARRLAAYLGLLRDLDASIAREVPPEYARAARAMSLTSRQQNAAVRELLMMERTAEPPPSLGSLPLTVLTADRPKWSQWPAWKQMQEELAALSTSSVHITARTDQHYIHLYEPDLVIRAIRDLVQRCRTSTAARDPGRAFG